MIAQSMNKLGILFDNRKNHPVEVAVSMALRQFVHADHTQGHKADEVYFHPDEAPDAASIAGLTVYTDKLIPRWHIRITTHELEGQYV
jgi:hypothetical protein